MCANSLPALNDVTYPELVVTLRDAAKVCDVIKQALENNMLIAMETAQASPCLDLRYVFSCAVSAAQISVSLLVYDVRCETNFNTVTNFILIFFKVV